MWECPASPVFSAPVFTDLCEGVIAPLENTVTNVVGCTKVIARTWTATDSCGNSTNRTQTITVIDTTAPAVTTAQGADGNPGGMPGQPGVQRAGVHGPVRGSDRAAGEYRDQRGGLHEGDRADLDRD